MDILSRLPNEILENIISRAATTRGELIALSICSRDLYIVARRLLYRRLIITRSGAKGPRGLHSVLRNIINDRNLASGVQELVIREVHGETPGLIGASLTSDSYSHDALDKRDSRLFTRSAHDFPGIDDENPTRIGWITHLSHGCHDAMVALLLCHVLPHITCLQLDLGAVSWMSRSTIRMAADLQNEFSPRFTKLERVVIRGPIDQEKSCETALLSVSSLQSFRGIRIEPFCPFLYYTYSTAYVTTLELHGCSLTSQDLEGILRRQPKLCHLSLRLTRILFMREEWGLDDIVLALGPALLCLTYLELSGPGFDSFHWGDLPSGLIHLPVLKTVVFDSAVFYVPDPSIINLLPLSLETLEFRVSSQQEITSPVILARMLYCLSGTDSSVSVRRLQRVQVKIQRPAIGKRLGGCPEADNDTTALVDRFERIFAQLGPRFCVCWINDWINDEDDTLHQDNAETRGAANENADEWDLGHESGSDDDDDSMDIDVGTWFPSGFPPLSL